jgi:hypothetical protein
MLKKFGINDLPTLDDGRVAATVDKLIRTVVEDCSNRPGVGAARDVTLKIKIKPQTDERGMCTDVHVDVVSSCTVPNGQSKTFAMAVRPNGTVLFNDLSPDQPRQHTTDEVSDG